MDQVKETIKEEFENKKVSCMPFWKILDGIWNNILHHPINAVGYFLNPSFFYYDDFVVDVEIAGGFLCCILRMVEDKKIRDLILQQLDEYREAKGPFGWINAVDQRSEIPPAKWCSLLRDCESNAKEGDGDSNEMIGQMDDWIADEALVRWKEISLDNLPIKWVAAIEESGFERFPLDIGYDQKRTDLIRRIDFAWAVEKDTKKQKTLKEAVKPRPWKSLMENLQLAYQEVSVITDLIHTVEANDAEAVAGMTRPKQLPNEVAKETRFYGALIRLQQNWKVKRQRLAVSAPGSEGFTIDLFDNSVSDQTTILRSPFISIARIDRDSAGMLAVQMPSKSSRSIRFGFLGAPSICKSRSQMKYSTNEQSISETKKESGREDEVDKCTHEAHSTLRQVYQAIFDEQVFDLVNCEAFKPSPGVDVTGIRENYLQIGICQDASVYLSLVPTDQDADPTVGSVCNWNLEDANIRLDTLEGVVVAEEVASSLEKLPGYPNSMSCEIYLQQIFHDNVFVKEKYRDPSTAKTQISGQSTGDGFDLLGHFCMTLAHRIFSKKVLNQLENLAKGVPYLYLISHPTWHSRTSSWSLSVKVPHFTLHAGCRTRPLDIQSSKKVRVHLMSPPNDSNLADVPVILLQQIASQVVRWLYEEALVVGMKASRDFLSLFFELGQGGRLCLVAYVDPNDANGYISWWLVMVDGLMEEGKFNIDFSKGEYENVRFLGHLSLRTLYSTLIDLVCLCNSSGSF
ncbi:hypothetical protein GIB67_040364 [Kingdonia uniflora]|uniref:Mediator complex subunit 17 n=1 Tax=Kingdonia uniflora TaxID=39325 RepID=A0A7J7L994_9MAGN|nr:hypothetical protein GIB67_040364 [Kingdonia uniflora]